MKGYSINIEKAALENTDFRRVLYTAPHCQLVLMSIRPGEDIGMETHKLDQFIRVESGQAVVVLDGASNTVSDGDVVVIPQGTQHNVTNTGDTPLKLYSIYSPPEHRDAVIHVTKADAEKDSEHFDGKTTE